jgi:methionyl-tRNA formyltransferase
MKIIYFGTPQFSANVLSHLILNGIKIVAVVSKPDKPKGRSAHLIPTPVKQVTTSRDPSIPILQPEKISATEFSQVLPSFDADLFVVVAYGEILKQHVLDIPPKGCINLHVSLLPKFRGAAPIQRCLIAGERETGVTIMRMVKKMDGGDIIRTATTPIGPNDTFGQIEQELCELGAAELLKVIHDFENDNISEYPQDESQTSYAPKIELEDCHIDWSLPAYDIHNLIRGVNPYPGAWSYVLTKGKEKMLKIWSTRVIEGVYGYPKQILSCDEQGLLVSCGQGALLVLELQLEGKRSMPPAELLRGTPISFI